MKDNNFLKFGVDYKDLRSGESFEQFVKDNDATIWHHPDKVKREIAMNEVDKNQSSAEKSNSDKQPVMPIISPLEPLGFITECVDDIGEHTETNNDEDDESQESGSDNEQSSSKKDSLKSAPSRKMTQIDIESLDGGGSLDQGGVGRTSKFRRS